MLLRRDKKRRRKKRDRESFRSFSSKRLPTPFSFPATGKERGMVLILIQGILLGSAIALFGIALVAWAWLATWKPPNPGRPSESTRVESRRSTEGFGFLRSVGSKE
jgi:hypothetical protein